MAQSLAWGRSGRRVGFVRPGRSAGTIRVRRHARQVSAAARCDAARMLPALELTRADCTSGATASACFSRRLQTTQRSLPSSLYFSPSHGPSRRPPSPVLALEGATSYRASVVANPPGHNSRAGFQATSANLVAPRWSARGVRLRQPPRPGARRGTGAIPLSNVRRNDIGRQNQCSGNQRNRGETDFAPEPRATGPVGAPPVC